MSDRSMRSAAAGRTCARWPRTASAIAAALVSLLASVAAADEHHAPPQDAWVIPPGQESALATMLGGEAAVAGCVYQEANMEQDRIHVRYRCEPGATSATLVLRHRPAGACAGTCTEKFTLAARQGENLPAGLVDAVAQRVRAGEGAFRWVRAAEAVRSSTGGANGPNVGRIAANVAVGLVVAFVAARMVVRSRKTA